MWLAVATSSCLLEFKMNKISLVDLRTWLVIVCAESKLFSRTLLSQIYSNLQQETL